jgi:hypothetical protein
LTAVLGLATEIAKKYFYVNLQIGIYNRSLFRYYKSMNQKSLTLSHQALYCDLAQNCNVRCLGTLGSFFNNEFNFLAFSQVTETVTLNGGEMDEHVRSTFALDKAEAFVTIEPLYCTTYTIRHFLPPLAIEKIWVNLFVPSEV